MYASITRCAKYLPKKSNYHFCLVNKDTQVWLPNSFAWGHTAYQRWNSTQAFCIPGLYLNAYPLQMEEKDEWLWIEIFFQSAEGIWVLKHARLPCSQLHPKMHSENKTRFKWKYLSYRKQKAFGSIYFEIIIFLQ